MKKYASAFLSLLLAVSAAGCSGSESSASPSPSADPEKTEEPAAPETTPAPTPEAVVKNVNLREILAGLFVNDEKLGINGKYEHLTDIKDGSIDPELVGTWTIPDTVSYIYKEDGTVSVKSEEYGNQDNVPFTCLKIGDYNLIAEEVAYTEDSDTEEKTVLTWTSYKVDNGALYMTTVEEYASEYTFYVSPIQVMYKEDASGSTKASAENNPISVSSFNGTWTADETKKITIKDDTLTAGDQEYRISMGKNNTLVVEKDGTSTAYAIALAHRTQYGDDKTDITKDGYLLSLSYIGKDENDRPNLADVLIDWHKEYDWNEFRFNNSFEEIE
ncbi:MAG: hypothetical protein K6A40_09255 [Solobacterium sp.]|nr:hypothetical protein [Solobacterium sp.]